jgi:hypothetical protein
MLRNDFFIPVGVFDVFFGALAVRIAICDRRGLDAPMKALLPPGKFGGMTQISASRWRAGGFWCALAWAWPFSAGSGALLLARI